MFDTSTSIQKWSGGNVGELVGGDDGGLVAVTLPTSKVGKPVGEDVGELVVQEIVATLVD